MPLIDWAARWDPVPQDGACRVWLPAEPTAPAARAARPDRPPRPVVLTLSTAEAQDLPCRLGGLLSRADVRPGDAVTVDLGSAASVHLTGLELLLTVLWRRVGASGDVTLVGGTPGLAAQLGSLGITADACRAAVHGSSPAPRPCSEAPAPATTRRPAVHVPAPRRPSDPPVVERTDPVARLVLAGEVNLTIDLRTQARLHELVEPPTRVLEVDVSGVSHLSLSSLRLLLAADAALRARGGRVVLRGLTPPVARLLAVTRTAWLADERAPAPRPRAVDAALV